MPAAPAFLEFDQEPTDEQLTVVLGPDLATRTLQTSEDGERFGVGPERIPKRGMTLGVLGFAALFSALPWVLPELGVPRPAHLSADLVIGMTAMMWFAIVPGFLGLIWWIDGQAAAHGPGAIWDGAARALELPLAERVVPAGDVVALVELSGRRRYSGNVSTIVQFAALARIEDGAWLYACIGKCTARGGGRPQVAGLAERVGVRMRRIRGGRID